MEQNKHAYLIIAHDQPVLLNKLLTLIDDERNDIFLHIDCKSKKIVYNDIYRPLKSSLVFTKRVKVYWGDYSQIETELILFETAFKNGPYEFYHLLSGCDLPIKTQDYIHSYFKENAGYEFIQLIDWNGEKRRRNRINHYHIPLKTQNRFVFKTLVRLDRFSGMVQSFLRINRVNEERIILGPNWCSVTNKFVKLLIENKESIEKEYRYTLCCDEVYKQMLVYKNINLFKLHNVERTDKTVLMRDIDWDRGRPYTWQNKDFEELITSPYLFARKFNYSMHPEVVEKIVSWIEAGGVVNG